MRFDFPGGCVLVKVGDITKEKVDAVVNAANSSLLGGAGVDGAIHSKGGPRILEECRKIRESEYPSGLPTGEAVVTTAGDLPSRFVIHTVGPIYGQNSGRDEELLTHAYRSCLSLAGELRLDSIAFPSISTGVYGYPKDLAAVTASIAVKDFLIEFQGDLAVSLVFFSLKDFELFGNHHKF